jgi:hypothetical protein
MHDFLAAHKFQGGRDVVFDLLAVQNIFKVALILSLASTFSLIKLSLNY